MELRLVRGVNMLDGAIHVNTRKLVSLNYLNEIKPYIIITMCLLIENILEYP